MAKIYAQANRVIIYLGEAVHNSDQVLENIRAIIEDGPANSLLSKKSQEVILKLLERL
jgi:hypothetical protein